MNRRYFIFSSTALAAQTVRPSKSPNETVRVAVVGCGGRGNSHMSAWTSIPNVELAGLVDVDNTHSERFVGALQKRGKTAPKSSVSRNFIPQRSSQSGVEVTGPN